MRANEQVELHMSHAEFLLEHLSLDHILLHLPEPLLVASDQPLHLLIHLGHFDDLRPLPIRLQKLLVLLTTFLTVD